MLIPVILSGGSGTRLWPLSTPERPKQFLPLLGDRTLFQETLRRLDGLPGLAPPIIVCNAAHRELVASQLGELGVQPTAIILEPAGRNTAPAIAVAALMAMISCQQGSESAQAHEPLLLVLPADHLMQDAAAFRSSVKQAILAAEAGRIVTFGIVPSSAETGYGYIEAGPSEGQWHSVARFVEKPDLPTAERFVSSGRYFWNSGMFVFGASAILRELGKFAPDIAHAATACAPDIVSEDLFAILGPAFLASPSESIDYAVMEKTDLAAVVSLDAGWSDVGSWSALFDALPKDESGNVLSGNVTSLAARSSLVIGGERRIALLGVTDLVVIDTGDTVLVLRKDQSQLVKDIVQKLELDSLSSQKQ